MNFLPVVGRELRVAARQPGTYRLRCAVVLAVFGLWLILLSSTQRVAPAQRSQNLFLALAVLAFGFCLLAGLIFTADCLTSEKRNGTLGLLFLTDLKGHDVVLGKLAATSLHAFYGLLGVLPVLAFPLLMGGVNAGEYGRLVLVLIAVLFQSLSLSLLVSAVSRETREALMGGLLLNLILAGILPAIYWTCQIWFKGCHWLLLACPAYTLQMALESYYRAGGGAGTFWTSLSIVVVLGLAAQVLACLVLSRVWREQSSPRANKSGWGKWLQIRFANRARRRKPDRQELELNPYGWLALHDFSQRVLSNSVLGLCGFVWLLCLAASMMTAKPRTPPVLFIICLFSAYGLHQLVKVFVAAEATRRISEDRESGNLELVLTTPISPFWIWSGVRHALRKHVKPALQWLRVINCALMGAVLFFSVRLDIQGRDLRIFLGLFGGGLVMVSLDYWALSWVGLAASLRTKQHHRAILITLGKVMLPTWLAIFLLVFTMSNVVRRQETIETLFFLWFTLGAANDCLQSVLAQRRVRRSFQRLAQT